MGKFKCEVCWDHTVGYEGRKCPDCPPDCPSCGAAPPTPPEAVDAFRVRLASREWFELVIRARRQLGIDGPGGITLDDVYDALGDLHRQTRIARSAASGDFDPSGDTLWPECRPFILHYLYQLNLAAATLASYLGTRSTRAMVELLVGFVAPDPDELELGPPISSKTTEVDRFEITFSELMGVPEEFRLLDAKDEELVLFLWVMRRKAPGHAAPGFYDWDGLRGIWNGTHPKWRYETKESFRKACERALEALKDAADNPPAGPD